MCRGQVRRCFDAGIRVGIFVRMFRTLWRSAVLGLGIESCPEKPASVNLNRLFSIQGMAKHAQLWLAFPVRRLYTLLALPSYFCPYSCCCWPSKWQARGEMKPRRGRSIQKFTDQRAVILTKYFIDLSWRLTQENEIVTENLLLEFPIS